MPYPFGETEERLKLQGKSHSLIPESQQSPLKYLMV
jgi:hypothetical protein